MTTAALSMVDQVLAGFDEYAHYFAIEHYYTGTATGPQVTVYLSKDLPVLTGLSSVLLGAGIRVDCYTSAASVIGAARMTAVNFSRGTVVWGLQEFVCGDAKPSLIGGVLVDVPASYVHQQNQAVFAGAAFCCLVSLLLVFCITVLAVRRFR